MPEDEKDKSTEGDSGNKGEERNWQEDYSALQSSYDKEVKARKTLETKFATLSKTTEDLQKAVEGAKQKEAEQSPESLDKWKRDKETEIRSSIQDQLDSALTESKSLKERVNELTVVNSAFSAIADHFNEDCFDDVKGKIRQFCVLGDDGKTVIVKDENGDDRYSTTNRSKKMTVAEFGTWLAEQKPSWAKATQKAGGRSTGQQQPSQSSGGNGGGKMPPAGFQQWSQRDQQEWMTKNPDGARAYMKSLGL